MLTSLVNSFQSDPSALLTCLVPLPLKSSLRHSALVLLQGAVKVASADLLCAACLAAAFAQLRAPARLEPLPLCSAVNVLSESVLRASGRLCAWNLVLASWAEWALLKRHREGPLISTACTCGPADLQRCPCC